MPSPALDLPRPQADQLPLVLSPAQLAEVLRVPVKTVYLWNSAGTGPQITRLGKHIRFHRDHVTSWLAQRAGDSAA